MGRDTVFVFGAVKYTSFMITGLLTVGALQYYESSMRKSTPCDHEEQHMNI
jgi:hypothetical protein